MDKARHPHVVRTWTVERTKVPYRPPQPSKLPSNPHDNPHAGPFRGPGKNPRVPGSAPKSG